MPKSTIIEHWLVARKRTLVTWSKTPAPTPLSAAQNFRRQPVIAPHWQASAIATKLGRPLRFSIFGLL